MNKDVIDLLEKVDKHIIHHTCGYTTTQDLKTLKDYVQQALILLKQQPTPGEFTMRFRAYLDGEYRAILLEPSKSMNRPEVQVVLKKQLLSEAKEACDRLDSAEAENKRINAGWATENQLRENLLQENYQLQARLDCDLANR